LAGPVLALQPPAGADQEWKSVNELPPTERLPAAPFLISAYVIIWMIAMFYLWTIWRRVNALEADFRSLERRGASKGQR